MLELKRNAYCVALQKDPEKGKHCNNPSQCLRIYLLRITFTFVYFSVGFIWKNGSNLVSSQLVRTILPFITNSSRKFARLKVCFGFYLIFI